ncbi:homophilic cell adhesion via plasma membrane adhesion molecules [Pristimantis euphronides]
MFNQDTYRIRLQENAAIGSLVIQLNATDEDEGSNAEISYSFSHISDKARQLFTIDSLNGGIKVLNNLDYETSDTYEMTVEAKDGGGHVTHCKLSVQVIDVNDNAPEISITSPLASIPEDSPPGTVIALLNVHDLDSGVNSEVVCHISDTLAFQLIPSSSSYYKLVTAANMDRERNPSYNVTIQCMDSGSPPLSTNKTLNLNISDVNDNAPAFEKMSYILYIGENNQPGTSIQTVRASDSDSDENGKITYSILNSNVEEIPVSSYISINSISGVIYAQRSFDYEQLRDFQFQVMAKDSGSPPLSSNVIVRICIIDKNDNAPKILYPSLDTEGSALFEFIPHSAEKGYLVTKVIAVDADSGHNAWLSYHLLQVPDPSLFTIGQYTGEIRIGRDVQDTDSLRQKIVVLVKDNGVPSLSCTASINLVVAESFQEIVPEIKRQPNVSHTSSNVTFYLVVSIGLISILFIATVLISIVLKCRKSSSPTTYGAYSRNVYPQFTLGCPSEISDTSLPFPFSYDVCVTMDSKQNEIAYLKPVENVPTENLIDTGEPTALNNSSNHDPNSIITEQTFREAAISIDGAIELYSILHSHRKTSDATMLLLLNILYFNYLNSLLYHRFLTMNNTARPRGHQCKQIYQVFCFLFFFIHDTYGQLQYSVHEEMKRGSVIGNVAKDLGLNVKELADRKFQLISKAKIKYFHVNLENGDLFVSERIDRETLCGIKPSCFINLEAVIEKPLNFYTITIEIQDVNDNAPIFSKKHFDLEISELTLPGARFALGNAQDPDLGTNSIQGYTLSGNENFGLGEKMTTDGIKYPEIILEKSLDREKQSFYELILTALDGGNPQKSSTATVKIIVQDVNDNLPMFNQDTYRIRVQENAAIGSLVIQLNATDEDEGSNAEITYSFSHVCDNGLQLFTIDSLNGDIKVLGKLDYELSDTYEMTVEAKDGGGHVTHCKVSVQVIDVNDNAPEITITSPLASIPEDSPPGTVIALLNVHDLDTGVNSEVVCHISDTLAFQLIPSSSSYYKLVTAANMDREKNPSYNVTIQCMDSGSPPLSTNKTLHLNISDVNDNAPAFEKMSYILYIGENNQPGTSIYNVRALDSDNDENGKITYSILNSNVEEIPVSSYISINSISGVIYAQRSFDYEQLREFQFQVTAKDSGSPPLSSNVTVRICIIDKNDNAPKILYPSLDSEGSALFEFIPHSAEKGYLVTKVIAVDADSGHNAWLSYHLLQVPDPTLFSIGQYTGEIRIGRDVQDTDTLRQKIVVLVKDNGVPSLSCTASVNLVVAENFQQVVPEIKRQPNVSHTSSNVTFYLVVSIGLISILFIATVLITIVLKCRKSSTPTTYGAYSRNVYPQFTLGCPSEISDTSLPFPFSYDVCVTMDSKQNEIAYLKPVENVPTENLIDTEDLVTANNTSQTDVASENIIQV